MPGRFLILHQSLQAPLRHSWFFFWDHAVLGSLSLLTPGTQVTGYRPQTEPGWPELCQCICGTAKQEAGLNPWVGKIPWSRKWQPTPVFLSGEFHGQGSLAGYHPWGHKIVRNKFATKLTKSYYDPAILLLNIHPNCLVTSVT